MTSNVPHFRFARKKTIKRTSISKADGLKLAAVKVLLAALIMTWLKRLLSNDRKIAKILHPLNPSIKMINKKGEQSANIVMLRANNSIGVDVFKLLRNLCHNINVFRFPSTICS